MLFIHDMNCISPQKGFANLVSGETNAPQENKLLADEPKYENIPLGILRRMGKAVRMGVGAALPLTKEKIDGIVIGTSNGGMEDCIKFLNQIIHYEEGMLTPTNFVQSTTNAVAGQIGLLTSNHGYNCTHVHRGLAFENAIMDVDMLLRENPAHRYLLGALDEISAFNYNIELLAGWYKSEKITGADLFKTKSNGSMAGEVSTMFLTSSKEDQAIAKLIALKTLHTEEVDEIIEAFKNLLEETGLSITDIDLYISGENGDIRLDKYYAPFDRLLEKTSIKARYKHLFGEFPTASTPAFWLACHILKDQQIPESLLELPTEQKSLRHVLIYNNYKGAQHSFMILAK